MSRIDKEPYLKIKMDIGWIDDLDLLMKVTKFFDQYKLLRHLFGDITKENYEELLIHLKKGYITRKDAELVNNILQARLTLEIERQQPYYDILEYVQDEVGKWYKKEAINVNSRFK